MSTDVVKYAFVAGEISPTLFGRGDLTKYDFGMAEAHNFFVDYRGGLSSRPGFQFCELIRDDSGDIRIKEFVFSPDIENTYVLVFGDSYVRFIQDGSYVLEDPLVITGITQASPGVVTSMAHGLTDGKWIKLTGIVGMTELNGRTLKITGAATDTFQLIDPLTNDPIDTTDFGAYVSGGTIEAVYEISSPYPAVDLDGLSFDQYRDYIRITREGYPPHDLIRSGHTDWEIVETEISPYVEGPTITGHTESASGAAETLFAVTSVYADGSESAIGNIYKATTIVNYPVTEGSVSITWTPDPEAIEYKVYRSIVSVTEVLSYGSELGYAGRTRGTKFTDPNIIPDFGKTPPSNYHPFAPGAIIAIKVTGGGAGYSSTSTITMGGGGTGFDGQVITDDAGAIVQIIIKNGGKDYVSPTITAVSGGAGATFEVTARETSGTNPALSRIFQQRQIYAASLNNPVTIWGSQYKRFGNFSSSDFVLDSDAFEFDIDTAAIAPIKHLVVTRGGMLAMTQKNVWMINGGGANEPITPTNALADPQTYTGVSDLEPITIDSDILYVEGKGYAVRVLSYNEISRVYSGDDKSILSNHLFGQGKRIVRWAYQESPFKVVWGVRSDGALTAFTFVKSEDVFAWTPCTTKGKFVDILSVQELTEDRVYAVTERLINNRWTKFIERMDLRSFVNVEDAWCVDAGLALDGTTPAADIIIYHLNQDEDDEEYYVRASAAIFTTDDVGKTLRAGNGIFLVTAYTEPTRLELQELSAPTNWIPQNGEQATFRIYEGEWTLDAPVTTLSGLWHLEGEEVTILGDGNVFPTQTVVNGSITLESGVTRAIVGLPYRCKAKTLPMIVPEAGIESRRKRIPGIAVRLTRSRGLKYGDSYERLYEVKDRTNENWGQAIRLQEGIRYFHSGTSWSEEGQTCFQIDDPLPVTLLSIVSDIEVGDEPD